MHFAPFTRGEKRLLIAVFTLACFMGSLAAFAAYTDQAEAQFHGGVLEEDVAEANFSLFWDATSAFARWGLASFLIIGVAPIAVRRLLLNEREGV